MLGQLTYTADPSKNKSGENVEVAAQALQAYRSMDKSKKRGFLEAFGQRSGPKYYSWVKSFTVDVVTTASTTTGWKEAWMNRTD